METISAGSFMSEPVTHQLSKRRRYTVKRHVLETFSVEIVSRTIPTDVQIAAAAENPCSVQVLKETIEWIATERIPL
jgi:hypothetical protein